MTLEQVELVDDLVRQKLPYETIIQMMGVEENTPEHLDLRLVILESEWEMLRASEELGEHSSEKHQAEVGTEQPIRR